MTHLVLDAADMDAWTKHHAGGLLIPAHKRPTVLQPDREAGERETLRLASSSAGLFVLFAPVAIARRVQQASHVNLRGEVLRYDNVVRLLPVVQPGGDEVPF